MKFPVTGNIAIISFPWALNTSIRCYVHGYVGTLKLILKTGVLSLLVWAITTFKGPKKGGTFSKNLICLTHALPPLYYQLLQSIAFIYCKSFIIVHLGSPCCRFFLS